MNKCIAPVEKFRSYIFLPGATHGKDHIFRSLGYDVAHSVELAELYSSQAEVKYAAGEFTLGRADEYGQRISIVIDLMGRGNFSGNTSNLVSGWMVRDDGTVTLNTPFSGFARKD